jgi:hypothetical protein
MSDENETGDPTDDLETMFEGWFQERMEREEAKKNRAKQPKDFGEFLDKVADAVWEKGEARAAQRREQREEGEQAPARGASKSAIERWWTGDKEQSA